MTFSYTGAETRATSLLEYSVHCGLLLSSVFPFASSKDPAEAHALLFLREGCEDDWPQSCRLRRVNWHSASSPQMPSVDIFLLFPVSLLLCLGETLWSDIGMHVCNESWIQGGGPCWDDSLSDFGWMKPVQESLFRLKVFAKLIFYIHTRWYWSGNTSTVKSPCHTQGCICERFSKTFKKSVLSHFYSNKVTSPVAQW